MCLSSWACMNFFCKWINGLTLNFIYFSGLLTMCKCPAPLNNMRTTLGSSFFHKKGCFWQGKNERRLKSSKTLLERPKIEVWKMALMPSSQRKQKFRFLWCRFLDHEKMSLFCAQTASYKAFKRLRIVACDSALINGRDAKIRDAIKMAFSRQTDQNLFEISIYQNLKLLAYQLPYNL